MKKKDDRSIISKSELAVLSFMSARAPLNDITEVSEISVNTGIRDSDEIIRALYTLEGKSLVSPSPIGDFTSNQWTITEYGVKAMRIMQREEPAATI